MNLVIILVLTCIATLVYDAIEKRFGMSAKTAGTIMLIYIVLVILTDILM